MYCKRLTSGYISRNNNNSICAIFVYALLQLTDPVTNFSGLVNEM